MMLTTAALWMIYIASYLVDYLLILIILIARSVLEESLQTVSRPVVGGLILIILFSIYVTAKVGNMKMNTRVRWIPEKNITMEMNTYIFAQVAAIATTFFTEWWVLIDTVIIIVLGFYFVKSREVYTSILFVFPLMNKIYKAGDCIIITNYTEDEMRIAQEDNVDGLPARELSKQIYLVRKSGK